MTRRFFRPAPLGIGTWFAGMAVNIPRTCGAGSLIVPLSETARQRGAGYVRGGEDRTRVTSIIPLRPDGLTASGYFSWGI